MNKIKKFFKILYLFIFCIKTIQEGHNVFIKTKEVSMFENIRDIWNYCKKWEEGRL